MTKLPKLGGDNGFAYMINNRDVVAGTAETDATDPTSGCPVNQFEPVIWENGKIHPLPPSHGDSDGVAAQINDKGQVVGASGTCGSFNPNTGLYLVENHAVLWENGKVTDLGNLGGNGGPVGNAGNHACAVNNRGQVVGHSELGDSLASPFHGFLWTREMGKMLDLGTLPGPFGVTPAGQNDFASLALGINDGGKVVGASLDANFDPRAFLWENGVMTDLNTLVAANPSGLYLLEAVSIDSRGEITGLALANGQAHGFLAIPKAR
jgi:probable HAF family extracellular repeat protein